MNKKKILLVDDDQFMVKLYNDLLTNAGYQVEIVYDGKTALEKIKTGGWDLILLDILIPKLDGLQIVAQLEKEYPEALKQKLVFLTNLDKSEILTAINKHGLSYLIKSDLTPDQFVQKVNSFLT